MCFLGVLQHRILLPVEIANLDRSRDDMFYGFLLQRSIVAYSFRAKCGPAGAQKIVYSISYAEIKIVWRALKVLVKIQKHTHHCRL